MRRTTPVSYSLETLCAAIGARLGKAAADRLTIQDRRADRGNGETLVLATDQHQTEPFRISPAGVEHRGMDQGVDPEYLSLSAASDWIASQLQDPIAVAIPSGSPGIADSVKVGDRVYHAMSVGGADVNE